jgi:phage tail-like protein
MSSTAVPGRTFSWLVHPDQWARCAHDQTALLPDGTVELTWLDEGGPAAACPVRPARPAEAGSLAFDSWCRAYRSRPSLGRVDVLPAGSGGRRGPAGGGGSARGVLSHPTGLAVDRQQRLYIAETGADAVRVVDLRDGRLLRRVAVPGHPVDVAPDCGRALVLVRVRRAGRLVVLDGRRGARPGPELVRPCYPSRTTPWRLTSARDAGTARCPLVLWRASDGSAAVARPDGTVLGQLDGATDLDLGAGGRLVVGFGPGLPIRDFQVDGDRLLEREPLRAPGYDGGAVAIAPNGRVAFTTASGYGWTAGSAARRAATGRVVTYRLDSQAYRTRWGRVFLDACLPAGTTVGLRFVSTDADDVLDPIPATPPVRGARDVPAPGATPPLAPAHLLQQARDLGAHLPYRRPTGAELPWPPPRQDRLQTYESPVHAAPGRYLWIELLLTGNGSVSPTVGAVRVERPGHALLAALPRAWSRHEDDAAFLQRFLAPAEGLLHELDRRAAERAALVNPHSTPSEALAWLASFAALTLDRRWSEPARRTLVAELYPLFRRRGTIQCLLRLIEIYLGVRPALIETWRLRGLAGTVLGVRPAVNRTWRERRLAGLARSSTPEDVPAEVIGGAAARTSALGRFAIGGRDAGGSVATGDGTVRGEAATGGRPAAGSVGTATRIGTSYDATAHRFTVLVPGHLSDEQRQVVTDILADHRPAHTLVEICELGDGMRVGRSLRLDLTAYVGPPSEPATVVVGRAGLGVDVVLGSAAPGSRLDATTRLGRVRVG